MVFGIAMWQVISSKSVSPVNEDTLSVIARLSVILFVIGLVWQVVLSNWTTPRSLFAANGYAKHHIAFSFIKPVDNMGPTYRYGFVTWFGVGIVLIALSLVIDFLIYIIAVAILTLRSGVA